MEPTNGGADGELHVLFGAGQVGSRLAERLRQSGKRVRVAKRSPTGVPGGVELVTGNAADPDFCIRAAEGAATVYHCMNPPYSSKVWAEQVPRYMENLIGAAGRAGARLVVLDNLYMLGAPNGRPLDETTPMDPCSRKGEIRARAAERLFEAHRRGEVRATSGRASDYYGPGGTQTYFGDPFWPAALAGKTVRMPVNLDTVHTYHYIPDVAAALAALGTAGDDAFGGPWMLPCAPPGTTRNLAERLGTALGREIRLSRIPRWMLKSLGFFVPILRELDEMAYQWEEPFVVDDRRFRERFSPTLADPAAAVAATAGWAREHYPHS